MRRCIALLTVSAALLLVQQVGRGQFIAGDQLSGAHVSYSTTFPATENPISQGARWIGGATNGEVWTDLRTTAGTGVWGNQTGASPPPYLDSIGLLRPLPGQPWGNDQDLRCTLFIQNRGSWTGNHEVELLLRGNLAAGRATFYEALFSVSSDNPYVELMQWLGPLANNGGGVAGNPQSFTSRGFVNDGVVLNDGDRIRATAIGTTLRMYRQQGSATTWTEYSSSVSPIDISGHSNRYLSGMPGIGWWKNGTSGDGDYGCSSFSVDTW